MSTLDKLSRNLPATLDSYRYHRDRISLGSTIFSRSNPENRPITAYFDWPAGALRRAARLRTMILPRLVSLCNLMNFDGRPESPPK
jgi:hypothetical protein